MKQVFFGWIPKTSKATIDRKLIWEFLRTNDIFRYIGRKVDYYPQDWPPKKVRITVEIDEI